MKKISLVLMTAFLLSSHPVLAGPADPVDQATLSQMTGTQLQTEFDSTIQMARDAQNRFHQSRGRRVVTSMLPFVGAVGVGETAARVGNLSAYRHKLLTLKRELRQRFPKEWDETKKKWNIDDNYLER